MNNYDTKKWLYQFEAVKKAPENGKKADVIKIGVLKPTRKLKEDGEIFYASEVSRFAKAGVLPKAAWGTILSNSGGTISDEERERYGKVLVEFQEKSLELQKLLALPEEEKTKEVLESIKNNTDDLNSLRSEVQSFESSQISIFENTAEAKARNKAILWWCLNLTHIINEDGSLSKICEGATFSDKLDKYDSLEENEDENEFLLIILRRAAYLVALWFLGRASSKEDFELYDKDYITESSSKESTSESELENKSSEAESSNNSEITFIPEEIKS